MISMSDAHPKISAVTQSVAARQPTATVATIEQVSGLYTWRPLALTLPLEELRLDVDGHHPQMVASGTIITDVASRTHWIANLTATDFGAWAGGIWYKDGTLTAFPFDRVEIEVDRNAPLAARTAEVTFSGGGMAARRQTLRFSSTYFRDIEFEVDFAQGEEATLSINTCDHPTRPPGLPCEELTIEQVYRRAGFNASVVHGSEIPTGEAGDDALWTDAELHDAMQNFWDRYPNGPQAQWAMWVLFGSLHAPDPALNLLDPKRLGGIMFDRIGPNHRQGTAIFNDSFIADAPLDDANPDAWRRRMTFWTAVHEMGHGFNLAHAWEKAFGRQWIPLTNEPEARSFMNYPFRVNGGQAAFFADFPFRFGDPELLFVRHAPERFAQMGNADWFDNHGFQRAFTDLPPTFALTVRVNRAQPIYEFMEPVTLELKLTNASELPQLVDDAALAASALSIIVKREGQPARQVRPFAAYCQQPNRLLLQPGESIYDALLVTGQQSWHIAEPGNYIIQAAMEITGEPIVSAPLQLRVRPPLGYDEEHLAQDFFTEDVGRVLTFDGSRSEVLKSATDALQEVAEQMGERRVALHAKLALGNALARDYKELEVDSAPANGGLAFKVYRGKPDEARSLIGDALIDKPTTAAESFGHVQMKRYVDRHSAWLAEAGDPEAAGEAQAVLYDTMANREVKNRKVLDSVLTEIKQRQEHYLEAAPTRR